MRVRETHAFDWPAIDALTKEARFTTPALWRWEAYLTDKGFVVVEVDRRIEGALLACSEESPVAWMRLAAVSDALDVGRWLDISLPPVLSHLRTLNVRELAWMDCGGWAGPVLETHGFRPTAEVITLAKPDRTAPQLDPLPVTLRPAKKGDFGGLVAIDRKAFNPMWWHSEASIRRRAAAASCFTVAERGGEVIGYAERELFPPRAHLNRIAIDPDYQGEGIGALLLKHVLVSSWKGGAETVSLNTQRSNRRSRRLYDRFGFEATGDAVTVWALSL